MPHFKASRGQHIERVGLMFQHHQRDQIAVRCQILRRVEAIFQVRDVVAGRVVDGLRLLRRCQHKVAKMLLITMLASDIPAAPAFINRTLVSRYKAASRDDRMATGIGIHRSHKHTRERSSSAPLRDM